MSFSSVTSSQRLQIRAGPTASTLVCLFSNPPFKPTPASGLTLCSMAALMVTHLLTTTSNILRMCTLLSRWDTGTVLLCFYCGQKLRQRLQRAGCKKATSIQRFDKWCVFLQMKLFLFPTVGSLEIEPFYRFAMFKQISGSLAFFNYCFSARLFCVNTSWQ